MRRRKGFTLVEVAVSLVLVGLVIVSVYVTIASTTRNATKNKIHNFFKFKLFFRKNVYIYKKYE